MVRVGLVALVLAIFPAHGWGQSEVPLVLSTHAGGGFSIIDNTVTLFPDGRVTFDTASPFPANWSEQNTVGKLGAKTDRSEYLRIAALVRKTIAAHPPPFVLPHDSVVQSVYWDREGRTKYDGSVWAYGDKGPFIEEVVREFGKLQKLATSPVRALQLTCRHPAANTDPVPCQFDNVGSEAVTAVDPRGVPSSIRCLDEARHLLIQKSTGSTPELIEIPPKGSHRFEVELSSECRGAVIVKTTDLLNNPKYAGHALLGEWVSGPLKGQ